MKFKKITIKNFRNFDNIIVNLDNKNVAFGLNDIGKTNFLYALRFVFDYTIRRNNFKDSDYFNHNTNSDIEIVIMLDLSDIENNNQDTQNLIAKLGKSRRSGENNFYIKLLGKYEKVNNEGIPQFLCGTNLDELDELSPLNGGRYPIDDVFEVFYINSYQDINKLFKSNLKRILASHQEQDQNIFDEIKRLSADINNRITELSTISDVESRIQAEYDFFREKDISIKIRSEKALKDLHDSLVPYITSSEKELLFPTSGEGRKKILSYAIYNILAELNKDRRVQLFLIEEPETHIHRNMQISLSNLLFNDEKYRYLFLATHSPYVLYDMQKIQLIRIFNKNKIDSRSVCYDINGDDLNSKSFINKLFVEAIFADKVLIVEGKSELLLFEYVIKNIKGALPNDLLIFVVEGIFFDRYIDVLKKLGIFVVVKTDNDFRVAKNSNNASLLGFSRLNSLTDNAYDLPTSINGKKRTLGQKRKIYKENKVALNEIRKIHKVFMSKTDLENDLRECLGSKRFDEITTIEKLQDKKVDNMYDFIRRLTNEDCLKIYKHYNFTCLKVVCDE